MNCKANTIEDNGFAGDPATCGSAPAVLTQTAYDANSNTIRLVDNNGGTTAWLYDLLDRNTVMQFHDGSTRTNVFDPANDVIGYTDENGSVFANTFDVLGRKTAVGITRATGVVGTTAQAFDFDGLSRVTFCRDSVSGTNADAGFTYDSINRVLEEQQTYAGDTRYVTHNAWTSYPFSGFTFPNNRQTTTGFDALYRKNAIHETVGGASIAAWQFFGHRTATVTLGSGIVTSFMNDAKTRSAIQLGKTTPAWGSISTDHLGYDGSGRLIGKRHSLSGTVLIGFTTAYDPASNKLFERALHAESRSALYGMDSMDRLLNYSRGILATGGGSITTAITLPNTDSQRNYALDGLGNWKNTAYTPVGSSPGLDARTHNKLNQITQFDAPSSPTPILYDQGNNAGSPPQKGNGNIIDDGLRLNAFDALNRLITVTRKSGTVLVATYAYDALGRRIIKDVTAAISGTVPTGTSRYLLDGQQIVEELDGAAGSATLQYVWGQYIDELVQLNALVSIGPQGVTGKNYLLSDLLYRSAALTGNTGTIVEAYDTDAYGNTLLFRGPGTDGLWFTDDDVQAAYSACRYVFTGREWDAETVMYFYRARYHGPALGRFNKRDPLNVRGGANLYSYAVARPTVALDPLGLLPDGFQGARPTYTDVPSGVGPTEVNIIVDFSFGGVNSDLNEFRAGTADEIQRHLGLDTDKAAQEEFSFLPWEANPQTVDVYNDECPCPDGEPATRVIIRSLVIGAAVRVNVRLPRWTNERDFAFLGPLRLRWNLWRAHALAHELAHAALDRFIAGTYDGTFRNVDIEWVTCNRGQAFEDEKKKKVQQFILAVQARWDKRANELQERIVHGIFGKETPF